MSPYPQQFPSGTLPSHDIRGGRLPTAEKGTLVSQRREASPATAFSLIPEVLVVRRSEGE